MGEELSLAREEEERQSMLLVSTGARKFIYAPSIRNKRTQEAIPSKVSNGGEVEDTETKSQSSRQTKRANASAPKKAGRGRDNKNRKQNRRDEGKDSRRRRSAQELGITHPGSYCDELETVPHHWVETEKMDSGSLYRCKFCHKSLWLPSFSTGAIEMGRLLTQYGKSEGYCRFLNRYRAAKLLVAKMQEIHKLSDTFRDGVVFARQVNKILSDREYDKKEASNGSSSPGKI